MTTPFAIELEAYLDEALPPERMAVIEQALRGDTALGAELALAIARRDAGAHTLGAIWRRWRITCPDRQQLGGYLLGVLDEGVADYIRFHVERVGCRYCQANVADLMAQRRAAEAAPTESRRQKYFQSSAGKLRGGS